MFDSSNMKSRSRRCHNVWHVPRSNWMRRESTGAHFTLKLANSGRTSVGCARFKSPLAHQYNPRPDVGLYGIRGRTSGPMVAPGWHQGGTDSVRRPCHPSNAARFLCSSRWWIGRSSPYPRPDLQPVAARPPQAGALFTTARRVATLRLRADVAVNLSNGAAGLDASWSARWMSLGPSSYCCRSSGSGCRPQPNCAVSVQAPRRQVLLQKALLKPAHPPK